MKAIVAHEFGGPEVLKYEEVPDPVPGPGEVVFDVVAIGVNPAETYMRTGTYAVKPDLPYIPGGDAAGMISEVGEGVTELKVGDRVFCGAALGRDMTGCYAERVKRPAAHVMKLPANVDYAQGAALGVPWVTAHYALFARGGGRPGETVFIHGASGAVGTAAIQLARRAGMKAIGSGGSARGRELIESLGAKAVDHTAEGYLDEVCEAAGGEGPAMILEMLANVNLANDLELLAKFGRVIVIGNRGEVTINPRLTMMKELDIRGIALWNADQELVRDILENLISGLEDGSLSPVVGREMPLAEAAAAHEAVLAPGRVGKLVLVP